MTKISPRVNFLIEMTKLQTKISRRLDAGLNGISLNELIIMYHLSQSPDNKIRRVDLAEKLGLTASGITRLLLPMEKIGLVGREADKKDARVSYVVLARGGKTKFSEGLERIELFSEELIADGQEKKIEEINKLLFELSRKV